MKFASLTLTLLACSLAAPASAAGTTDDPSPVTSPAPTVAQASPAPSATPSATPSGSSLNLYDGNLHILAAPYLFLPNVNGSVNFSLPPAAVEHGAIAAKTIGVHIGPSSYLTNLNSAFMGYVGVQKGIFSALGDVIYLNLSSSVGTVTSLTGPKGRVVVPLTATLSTTLTGSVLELYGGATIAHGKAGNVNGYVGVRSLNGNVSAAWGLSGVHGLISRSGSIAKSTTITDGVVGVQGSANIGTPRWFVPYYADYGWGSGNSTAQQWLGFGYAAPVHGQRTILVYRNLAYFSNSGALLQNVRIGGPEIGYVFQF